MDTETFPTNYEQNAVTLQNLQNQNNVKETSTWVEWSYWYFTNFKIAKNVWELSKVVSPQQTIRQIATYTISPLTRKMDSATGLSNANIQLLGYDIPCSFSAFGTLATETLAMTTSPAQWAASKATYVISNTLANELITKWDLRNKGALGKEAAAIIQIGSTLAGQRTLEEMEKKEIVASAYKTVDREMKFISKPIDKFVNKQITSGLKKLGVDTTQPLGLTKNDIQLEKRLIASEEKVTDIEGKIQELKRQEEKLQEEVAQQERTFEQNNLDADKMIKKARKYEKDCPERKTMPKYEKHRKHNRVWAKQISEEFVSEFNISEQQRIDIQEEIKRELHHKRDEKAQNKAMKKVIEKHKGNLQDKSRMQLDDVKRARTNMQNKLVLAKQQYMSDKDNFDKETNVYQQAKFKNEQQERNKRSQENGLATANVYSGNIQLKISPEELKELENRINQHIEEQRYFKRNLNDSKCKVFLNGRINIDRDSLGNLGLKVPIKIDLKRMDLKELKGKVTKFNTDLYFNIQLADGSPEKLIDVNLDATHTLSRRPYYKLFSTFKLMRIGTKTNEILEPKLTKAISVFQKELNEALLKDNILSHFNENLPEGCNIRPGIINVRPRVDSSDNQIFDIDFNADFQCPISAEILKDEFKGYSVGDVCCFEKIREIKMNNGRIQVEVPISVQVPVLGRIEGNVVGSFDVSYCPERQSFSFNNLEVAPKETDSLFFNSFSFVANWKQRHLLGYFETYVNNNLENMRLTAINNVQQQLQKKIPGSLVVDADSIIINYINCENNFDVHFSLRS